MSLNAFLRKHKKSPGQSHTHTWFASGLANTGIVTLHIPQLDVPTLHKTLVESVALGEVSSASISEKFIKDTPFRYAADLDFKATDIEQWLRSKSSNNFRTELQQKLRDIVLLFQNVVSDFTHTSHTPMILATRLPYKIHLHFPDVIVNATVAKQLTKHFAKILKEHHGDIYNDDVVDHSIYGTGLRLLYCHKGGMMSSSKRAQEVAEHEAVFGQGTYRSFYSVTNIDTWDLSNDPCTVDLVATSTQVDKDTPLTAIRFPCSATSKGKKTVRTSLPQTSNLERHVQEERCISAELLQYLGSRFNMQADDIIWAAKTVHKGVEPKICIPTRSKKCPFAAREHRSNHLYIVLSQASIVLKCHDENCSDAQVVEVPTLPKNVLDELMEILSLKTPLAEVTEEMRLTAVGDSLTTVVDEHPRMNVSEPVILRTRLGGGDHWMCKLPRNMWCPLHQREHDSASNCIIMTLREQQIMCQLEPELLLELPLMSQYGNVIFGNQIINNNLNITVTGCNQPEIPIDGLFDKVYPIFTDGKLNQLMLESFNGYSYNIAKVVHHIGRERMGLGGNRERDVWWIWNETTLRWEENSRLAGSFVSVQAASKYIEAQHWFRAHTQDAKLRALREAKIDSIVKRLKDKDKRIILKDVAEVFDAMGEGTMDSKLDKDPYLLGFEREIYDLRTGTRKLAESTDYVSMSVGYELPQVVDQEIRDEIINVIRDLQPQEEEFTYLLTFLASTLDGRNAEEMFTIWTGDGRNGKGLLQDMMKQVVGNYYAAVVATFLTNERPDSSKPIPDVLNLRNIRFVSASEPEHKKQINAGFVKWLTGNDPISGCYKHENKEVKFRGQHSLIMLCNQIPGINAEDKAFWRRVRIQHFGTIFVDNPTPGTNERQIDRNLKLRVETWAPQMMLLLLEYYKIYRQTGLSPTAAVLKCTNSARNENNPLVEFVDEHYEKSEVETDRIKRKDIHDAFDTWCTRSGQHNLMRKKHRTQMQLKALLASYGFDLGEEFDSNGKSKIKTKRVGNDDPCVAYSYIKMKVV